MSIITPSEASQEAMTAKTQSVPPVERTGGSGSIVTVTPIVTTGTHIADIDVDGETNELYTPNTLVINGVTAKAPTQSQAISINTSDFTSSTFTTTAEDLPDQSFEASVNMTPTTSTKVYRAIDMMTLLGSLNGYISLSTTNGPLNINGLVLKMTIVNNFKYESNTVFSSVRTLKSRPMDEYLTASDSIVLASHLNTPDLNNNSAVFINAISYDYDTLEYSISLGFEYDSVSSTTADLTVTLNDFIQTELVRAFATVKLPYSSQTIG